jgi:hypothetical protein
MKANRSIIILSLLALLSIVAIPAIDYIGGRQCFPLVVPPLLPATIVPYTVWLFLVVLIVIFVVRSIIKKQGIFIALGALLIVLTSMWLFQNFYQSTSGFLWGLKSRFENDVGYKKMREYAHEYASEYTKSASNQHGIYVRDPNFHKDRLPRYSFLGWNSGNRYSYMVENVVEHTWGSPLTGHWGFQVSPNGAVKDIERCDVLRVSSDIQFVYYYD